MLDGGERVVVDVQGEVSSQTTCGACRVFAMANSDTWQKMRQVCASSHISMTYNRQTYCIRKFT